MKLNQILGKDKVTLSFEVFPPKTAGNYLSVEKATLAVASLNPSYMSVTYGAAGGTRKNTVAIASDIQKKYGVTAIAHLTCVGATKESIHSVLDEMKEAGIENILALRGDKPTDFVGDPFQDFRYASDLASEIRKYGDFCIGGACYPEGHLDAASRQEDILNLKKKVEAGCEFLTTQMFFDNTIMYNFLYRLRKNDINIPVVAGIMPITNAKQVSTVSKLSGTYIPERFKALVDRFGNNPAAMHEAGIAYATDQIIDLIANGVNNIHVYSMNKPEIAEKIQRNLSEIIKA